MRKERRNVKEKEGWDGKKRNGIRKGRDGMGWDGKEREGMGWDGKG